MTHFVLLTTLCALTLFVPVLAMGEPVPSVIPLPDPRINEFTLIQGTGWSAAGNWNESLACDLADNRAIQQLKKGIAVARARGMITTEELSRALPLTRCRNWDRRAGRRTIRLELEVRVLSKSGVPNMLERQF
jgi:hypothetical protein